MSEDLKVGQSVEYTIAEKKIVLKPMALGRMKRATEIFAQKSGDNFETIAKYLLAILQNDANKDAALTLEWIMENITFPEAQEMMRASKLINGLGDVFPKGEVGLEQKKEKLLDETVPLTPLA